MSVTPSDIQSWKLLPPELVKRYGDFGAGFIEIWYLEHLMQNYPNAKHKVVYNGPKDAVQVELGGGAIYQNITKDKFGGSLEFFVKYRGELRPIGGHDVDVLVLDEKKLTYYLQAAGYKPHPDKNQKYWYRVQQDPYTMVWAGRNHPRAKQLFGGQPCIQYDLFRNMEIANTNMAGCEKKLRTIKAFNIVKYNLCDEDLIVTKAKIYERTGLIPMGKPKKGKSLYSMRPKDVTDLLNLIATIDMNKFDFTYFVDRLEKNLTSEGQSSKGRKVGKIDSNIPWQERSIDQRVVTVLRTLYNQAKNNNLQQWISDKIGSSNTKLQANWDKGGYIGRTKLGRELKGIVFDWKDIEAKLIELVDKTEAEYKARW